MSDELKAMLRQAPMNGFAIRTLAYIEKLEAQLAARCSADSALSSKQRASKILFGDPTWLDCPDMAEQMDHEFVEDNGSTSRRVTPNQLIAELSARAVPQTAGAESHSPAAMEGEKDTIVNLIHEHVGFEVLLAIESGVLTGVEDAAEAILAELGRRSQAEIAK